MRPYERWVLANASHIRSADSLLNYLGMFIPGQTPQVELASEGAIAVLQLLGLYESRLVAHYSPGLSQFSQWLSAVYMQKKGYERLAYFLAILRSGEMFLETLSNRFTGSRGRWRVILGIESTKVALRLGLLLISRRPTPVEPVYGRDLPPEKVEELLIPQRPDAIESDDTILPRTGKRVPQLPKTASSLLSSKVLKPEDLRKDIDLIRPLSSQKATFAEILQILRPLIYASLAYKYRRTPKNWTPWVTGVLVEFIAQNLAKESLPARHRTQIESDNIRERSLSLVWWAFREPMWSGMLKPLLLSIVERFQKVPLIGIGTTLLEDWTYLFDEFYFASATQ